MTPQPIQIAQREAVATGRPIVEVLAEQQSLTQADSVATLADAFGYPSFTGAQLHDLTPAFDVLPFPDALRHDCLPFWRADASICLVISDPFAEATRRWAEERVIISFVWGIATLPDIRAYLSRQEESLRAMEDVVDTLVDEGREEGHIEVLSLRAISEHSSPVVKLVYSTLYDALKAEASDIHFETTQSGLAIKYRLDGVLVGAGSASGSEFAEQTISRIKVMADLDIAERRIPQDGRFKVAVSGRHVDFRVSIMPSVFGEDAVLRILDKRALADLVSGLRLDHLGFDATTIEELRALAEEPYGMFLVTGPTGSGKTTTLYAAISEINHGRDKIITIEDPVEYHLPGVLQIPVNEKQGLSFARGLRSVLRHDPDKIMVGEIRDPETAQIAVQAALTGHLVFTTLHANSALDVIGRFLHMGVDPYSFVSAVRGIVAQRLIRRICVHCATDAAPDTVHIRKSGLTSSEVAQARFRVGRGCGECRGTGYKGRHGIAEMLKPDDAIREMIVRRDPFNRIRDAAASTGTRFLRQVALDLACQGETTLEEVNRVTLVA